MTDRGSATPLVLVLLVGGSLLLGVTIDLGRYVATQNEVRRIALEAAEAGAAVIDTEAAYDGQLLLDVTAARRRAIDVATAVLPRRARDVDVAGTITTLCVRVTQRFQPGPARAVGARSSNVSAERCARPRSG